MTEPTLPEESLFLQAVEISSAEDQAAFLQRACGTDDKLRRGVEALLRHHREGSGFLESPPTEVAAAAEQLTGREAEAPSLDFLAASTEAGSIGRLGQYEIVELLGCGGFGVVLKARDTKLDRIVAIKTLAQSLASSVTARKRFVREAKAAAAVKHENVVGIYHVSDEGPVPYLVMECVNGLSLEEKLREFGTLDLAAILRIGTQIASGLAAAHKQGLVHRDVKPGNILLENGVERVKITDFGLARAANDAAITRTGDVAGTPQFMSPEQALAQPIDQRSDLFSLGSVLYAMCTGHSPFRAESTVAALRRVCDDVPRPICEVNAEVPAWLVAIIDRLLAKKPDERFQTADEVAELLGSYLAQVQKGASELPMVVTVPRSKAATIKRRRWISSPSVLRWMTIIAAAAVLLGLTLSLTEAGGVTHLAATVIRIFTPDGTLVVESDDPAVKVTIEGDGGVSITGAGPQEVRLRPGKYHVQATIDGKPVSRKLVEINHGDRKVVTVTREPTAPTRTTTIVPRLLSPVADRLLPNGLKSGQRAHVWEFVWSEVPGATTYELYVAGRAGSMPTVDEEITVTKKRLEYRGGYKRPDADWYWKVRAKISGVWNAWSEERPFRVAEPVDVGTGRQFYVLSRQRGAAPASAYDTLAEAVLKSSDGDTIEIRGNGPFETEPIRLSSRRTIRAGARYRPVIKTGNQRPSNDAGYVLNAHAPLVLEGLEFQGDGDPSGTERVAVNSLTAPLYVTNCRFTRCGLLDQFSPFCQVRNSQFSCAQTCPLIVNCQETLQATLVNNLALSLASSPLYLTFKGQVEQAEITSNTLAGKFALQVSIPAGEKKPNGEPYRVRATCNILAARGALLGVNISGPRSNSQTATITAAEGEDLLRHSLTWSGARNLIPPGVDLLSLSYGPAQTPIEALNRPLKTLVEWDQFWSLSETTSLEGAVRYQNNDLVGRFALKRADPTPDDFRLSLDSAGYRAGPDGKDLGADVEFVGPGEAYERWKGTPDYQEWLKTTGQKN